MTDTTGASATDMLWFAFGLTAQIVFQSRFYIQWLASELKRKSVVPVVFWYLSSAGSIMLLIYAVHDQSPIGALGQSLNIVIYSRNLIHIWRDQGRLTQRMRHGVHAGAALIAMFALLAVAHIWWREYHLTREMTRKEATQVWVWLAVGLIGQGLFAGRFIIQWIATEIRRKSVFPTAFWHLSMVASLLQLACFLQRTEWIFALGMVAGLFIYARNLWFIYRHRAAPEGAPLPE
ncbi:MAG: lipid-A-disaccharide synthase N-terminal domain-containing protein [Candidatus Hydrogenedentes bacterium]|nr:lipid-A-disaccharide synthase N-terminal domain-containing protein [Candidatus Hydrogenedentota bacterium]